MSSFYWWMGGWRKPAGHLPLSLCPPAVGGTNHPLLRKAFTIDLLCVSGSFVFATLICFDRQGPEIYANQNISRLLFSFWQNTRMAFLFWHIKSGIFSLLKKREREKEIWFKKSLFVTEIDWRSVSPLLSEKVLINPLYRRLRCWQLLQERNEISEHSLAHDLQMKHWYNATAHAFRDGNNSTSW